MLRRTASAMVVAVALTGASIVHAATILDNGNGVVTTCEETKDSNGDVRVTCSTRFNKPPQDANDKVPPPVPTLDSQSVTGKEVKGTAEPFSMVRLQGRSSGAGCVAEADKDGRFSCDFTGSLVEGEPILAFAVDVNGNYSAGGDKPMQNVGIARAESGNRSFLKDGIFGCAAGGYAMPVGTLRAIGGVYVPVNDAAVTLNTGYLVYKECVLDGVVVRMREGATGALIRSMLTWGNTGRDGKPYFPTNAGAIIVERTDEAVLERLKPYNLEGMCAPFKSTVRTNAARAYMQATREPNNTYKCSLALSDKAAEKFRKGDFGAGGFSSLFETALNPQNHPYGAYEAYMQQLLGDAARAEEELDKELNRGNGYLNAREAAKFPTNTGEERVQYNTLTPGYIISQAIAQAVTSGFRQLESASEIDQIVGSLLSGLTNQILTDARGLKGLSESRLGKPPYLDQLSAEASAGVRTAAANAALTGLNSTLASEEAFNAAKRQSKEALERAAAQLKRAEERCWEVLVPKVRAYAEAQACTTDDAGVRTCGPIPELTVSTSTPMVERGTVALSLATSSSIALNAVYTIPASPSGVINSGSVQFTATETKTFASATTTGLSVLGGVMAPAPGGTITLTIASSTSFTSGRLTLVLATGQVLPGGEARFPLIAAPPFAQAAVSLILGVAQQFSEAIISAKITPSLTEATREYEKSTEGIAELTKIMNDLRNTSSQTAQRIALERYDTLVGLGLIHSPYDVKEADQQKNTVESSMNTLVEDTIKAWGSGAGWCNAENEAVLNMWYTRWKVN